MTPIINITKSAWSKMSQISQLNSIYAFLFTVNSGGCSGFNYKLITIEKKEFNDLIKPNIFEYDGSKLAVDPLAEMYLLGTTIDYVKEDYNKNIFESKFIFIPDKNLATGCGCGVSFTPKGFF